jgi:citrate lyase gamma subunit
MSEILGTISVSEVKDAIEDVDQQEVNVEFENIIKSTFGSQVMKVYEGIQDLPVMTGGPTWTGTGMKQDADDGDTK